MENYQIQKLRELPIMQVADSLGMGIRQKRALCIHHADHHPSLAFNVRRNTCHCYSCGFSADTIGLVRERFDMTFLEACRWLAQQFGVYIGDTGGMAASSYGHRSSVSSMGHRPPITSSERRLASLREDAAPSQPPSEPRGVDVEYYQSLFSQMTLTPSGERFLLQERMISPEVIRECHIVSTERNLCMGRTGRGVFDGPSLLIPYYDVQGRLATVQSRYLGRRQEDDGGGAAENQLVAADGSSKGKDVCRFKFAPGSHRMMYGLERLGSYPPQAPILLTEGPSDCWTALTLGFHALAIPSATLFDTGLATLLQSHPLHIFPDQDEAGLNLYFALRQYFPSLAYHQLPEGCKDLSDHYLRLRRQGLTLGEARESIRSIK